MSQDGIRGVDLFKIAGESISGWIPSWKFSDSKTLPGSLFCSLMEERLLMSPGVPAPGGLVWTR